MKYLVGIILGFCLLFWYQNIPQNAEITVGIHTNPGKPNTYNKSINSVSSKKKRQKIDVGAENAATEKLLNSQKR